MASVSKDKVKGGFIITFRLPDFIPGNRRFKSKRVSESTPDPHALAEEMDTISDLLSEQYANFGCVRQRLLKRATELGVIPPDVANALADPQSTSAFVAENVKSALMADAITLEQAAEMHPVTRRESAKDDSREYDRHMRALREFVAWSGISLCRDMTLEVVLKYIEHLKSKGMKYDSIRHRLLYLRHACQMAPEADPQARNVFAGNMRLLRREQEPERDGWSFEELVKAAHTFLEMDDSRPLATLALGGFMGLRPSEIIRAQVGDVDLKNRFLRVGRRERKNDWSNRELPIPSIVMEWLTPILEGRDIADPIIKSHAPAMRKRPKAGHFNDSSFNHWFSPLIGNATGRQLPVKYLRKAFSDWALDVAGIPERHLEEFMGHRTSTLSGVTVKNYKRRLTARQLIEASDKLDAAIRQFLHQFLHRS